jgi:uncharacterized membrane protein YgdD (TMEM256/DUF423 family)
MVSVHVAAPEPCAERLTTGGAAGAPPRASFSQAIPSSPSGEKPNAAQLRTLSQTAAQSPKPAVSARATPAASSARPIAMLARFMNDPGEISALGAWRFEAITMAMNRGWIGAAAAGGMLAVGFGAFGAHAAEGAQAQRWLETGAQYQLSHAVAALAALAIWPASKVVRWAATLFVAGGAVFAISLYALALGAPQALGAATPLGGLALIAGWGLVLIAALTPRRVVR